MVRFASIPLLAAALALTACAPPSTGPSAGARYEAVLVDSVAWETEMTGGVAHRVEVRRAGRAVDTIPDLATTVPPMWVPREGIVGYALDLETGMLDRAFRYDPARARITLLPIPDDFNAFAEPALSPDGRYVAYAAYDGEGHAAAVVRRFPSGRVEVRSAPVEVEPGDVASNFARWTAPDAFEVWIDVGAAAPRWWRVRGTVAGGVTSVESATRAP